MAHRPGGKSMPLAAGANKIHRLWQSDHMLLSLPRSALCRDGETQRPPGMRGRICGRKKTFTPRIFIRYAASRSHCPFQYQSAARARITRTIQIGNDRGISPGGGGIKPGPTYREGIRNATQVQHESGKSDTHHLSRHAKRLSYLAVARFASISTIPISRRGVRLGAGTSVTPSARRIGIARSRCSVPAIVPAV
jgi:hypothetical protein